PQVIGSLAFAMSMRIPMRLQQPQSSPAAPIRYSHGDAPGIRA
ncbi:MAG: hypothetical protein RLY63_895, partial [Chloroflexota bacterium]